MLLHLVVCVCFFIIEKNMLSLMDTYVANEIG